MVERDLTAFKLVFHGCGQATETDSNLAQELACLVQNLERHVALQSKILALLVRYGRIKQVHW